MKWEIKKVNNELVKALAHELNINDLVAKLLVLRGITSVEDARNFLNPTRSMLRTPFLLKDMEKAVDILLKARQNKEKVIVHGDYDVDGITGTAVLHTFLSENGWEVDYYIPRRVDDGYGIQPQLVEEIAEKGVKVLLTVDCGITALEAIQRAKELDIKVIVTDHHQPKETLPNADAIINPKREDDEYPFKEFAGVGVAYKLVCALAEKMSIPPYFVDEYLDLVALGTVADMVELRDENRYIVKEGLKRLNSTSKLGIARLIQKLGIGVISSRDISYKIAPRLNAAGRLDSPDDAFKLIVTKDEANAAELVEILMEYNTTRQSIEARIYNEAVEMIKTKGLDKLPIVVAYNHGWHLGVIGIVATRLTKLYNKPVMVISIENGLGRGSARSINGVNIIELLKRFREIFEDFGGHIMALGFSIKEEKIPELLREIREKISDEDVIRDQVIEIDEEISVEDVNKELIKSIELLELYGHGNAEPVFLIRNCSVERHKVFGDSSHNIRLTLKGSNGSLLEGIGYGLSLPQNELFGMQFQSIKMDVVGNLRYSESGPLLNVLDLKVIRTNENDVVEKKFLDSFVDNWKKQREEEEEYDYKHYEDDIYSRLEKISNLINIERPALIRFKTTYRNAFFFELMRKGRVLIINPSSTEAMHIYESLQRHNINGLVLSNTINSQSGTHIITNVACADWLINNPSEFDFIVLNEIQFVKNFDKQLFFRIIEKFGKNAFFTTIFKFDSNLQTFEVNGKSEFSVEDKRNQPKLSSDSSSALVYLFSSHNSVEALFNTFVKKAAMRGDTVFYSSQLAPFQRLMISNLVRKRKIKRLISSTNTDGLPSLFGNAEVRLFDFPYTISELIDAVSGEGNVLLQLNYSSQDVQTKRKALKKLFPSDEELKNFVEETNAHLPMKVNEFLTSKFDIPKNVIKSVYRDLGGLYEDVIYPVEYRSDKISRLREREIELSYFERYTLQLESLNVREIYRLLDERCLHDVDLII